MFVHIHPQKITNLEIIPIIWLNGSAGIIWFYMPQTQPKPCKKAPVTC